MLHFSWQKPNFSAKDAVRANWVLYGHWGVSPLQRWVSNEPHPLAAHVPQKYQRYLHLNRTKSTHIPAFFPPDAMTAHFKVQNQWDTNPETWLSIFGGFFPRPLRNSRTRRFVCATITKSLLNVQAIIFYMQQKPAQVLISSLSHSLSWDLKTR